MISFSLLICFPNIPRAKISDLNRSKIRKYASENRSTNDKATDEELMKQGQQDSGTLDVKDIGGDKKNCERKLQQK